MKPTAWFDPSNGVVSTDRDCPLFTPLGQVWALHPRREWVDLTDAQISPSGLGVHFPKLDADLYIPALLQGFLGSRRFLGS